MHSAITNPNSGLDSSLASGPPNLNKMFIGECQLDSKLGSVLEINLRIYLRKKAVRIFRFHSNVRNQPVRYGLV